MSDEESVVELCDETTQIRQRNQTATSLRVIHLEDFEAPFTLPSEDREAYLRRFATRFVVRTLSHVGHRSSTRD